MNVANRVANDEELVPDVTFNADVEELLSREDPTLGSSSLAVCPFYQHIFPPLS